MKEQDGVKDERFGEKQERREFLKSFGKVALPAIAILGLGAFGNKLHGSNYSYDGKSAKAIGCEGNCSGGCKGSCKDSCSGGCEGSCKELCTGDCSGACFKSCSGTCKDDCRSQSQRYV
ncbi:MAG: hypothetical protein ACM3SY_07420 [Candidatus Omnitrophota bacterium]